MQADLVATLEQIRNGQACASEILEECIRIAQSPVCTHAFLSLDMPHARRQACDPQVAGKPLAGLAVSIKDLFDVQGQVTAAGSTALADAPPATSDSAAVARLRAAGAALLGRTNMTEFAFSGVGINPHFGTPVNPTDHSLARIPGGSSSGAAVSVATGAAFIGLGSDTGGSIRIPAALCGIVGFKNTARLTPTEGALPLSTTLDTACAMTRSVRDAILAHEILAARQVTRGNAPLSAYRFAVARTLMQDSLEPQVARAFDAALKTLRDAGATVQEITLQPLAQLRSLLGTGGFPGAESYAWHKPLLERKAAQYDPRVRARIERGAGMLAHEYVELLHARQAWIACMMQEMSAFDAILSPTVPLIAPPLADLAPGPSRDEAFFRANALLLRNPSMVNMLDGCAISIPCQAQGELAVGLMIWHGPMRDDGVLNTALLAEAALRATRSTGPQ